MYELVITDDDFLNTNLYIRHSITRNTMVSREEETDLLTKVGCVSGCQLTVSHVDIRITCNRLATYTLRCTHGRVYQNNGASTFKEGDVGPSNVVTEFIKRVKMKGATKNYESGAMVQETRKHWSRNEKCQP